jgi:hypothetical protein
MRGRRSAGLLVLVIALLAATPARAATYAVSTIADTAPGVPCAASCSLRSAVEAAGAGNGEADVIQVPAGTFRVSQTLTIPSGQVGITIAGAGADQTMIAGNAVRVLALSSQSSLTITGATVRDGVAGAGSAGGNIQVGDRASLTLDHVRVTAGTAPHGGGIGGNGAALIAISNSLIDTNNAIGTTAGSDGGGGIWITGDTFGTTLRVLDSTIAFNKSVVEGGGVFIRFPGSSPSTLRGVTLSDNEATTTAAGGLYRDQSGPALTVAGSIVARNRGNAGASNCGTNRPVDGGGNVESASDCGLAAAGRQNTDALLATGLAPGGKTPVLAIPANSPAIDLAACPSPAVVDQRDVPRPQGAGCDAGAYEYQAPAPPPTPTPTPTPAPTPTSTPTPTFDKTVVVKPVEGKVRVRRPGSATFVLLDSTQGIPLGSTVDTKDGAVELSSQPKRNGKPQRAKFFDGIFKVTQTRTTTDLTLSEPLAACPRGSASAAAKKPKTRKLWGDGSGSFRTRGQYSAATVRGTKWLVQDTCAGTLTRVTKGAVTVRDVVKRKTIILRAGKRYLARPKR